MRRRLLGRASWRFYQRHPWQLLLAVAGIALGVAVFLGIELANDSARRAFEASSSAASEQTTHRLLPVAGPLPEARYFELKTDQRWIASTPVIEAPVLLALAGGQRLEMMLEGLDVIEEPSVRGLSGVRSGDADLLRLLTEPLTVVLPQATANAYAIETGDSVEVLAGDNRHEVVVIGTSELGADGQPRLLTDIATAQELIGTPGFLTRIDLRLDEAAAGALSANLDPRTVLVPAGAEDQILGELTRAFNTNLTALGLLALVVGMFLIYSTISFTIIQRWRSVAVLRAIGLSRGELMGKLLGEALAIGIAGTLLGLLLGRELSAGLLELVLRTLDDLYFRRALAASEPSSLIYVLSALLGVGATVVSALIPAVAATRRDITSASRSRLERNAHRLARRFALAALPTLLLAGAILAIADRGLWQAFVAIFLVIVAGAMLVPLGTHGLMRFLEAPAARLAGIAGRMAVRGVTDSLSRTGVATAALAIAVATVMSVGLMIASFRASLVDWIDTTITADLYIDVGPELDSGLESSLTAIEALPEVVGISRMRVARTLAPLGSFNIRAQAPGPEGYGIELTAPDDVTAEALLDEERSVVVSEPLAYRLGLEPDTALELPTMTGIEAFRVAGIYRDYNTAGSDIVIALDAYRRHFDDQGLSTIGVHLAADADADIATAAIRALFARDRDLRIRSTEFIREISLVVFDRTFQVTEVLRLLSGIVAFLGILSALMALGLEREREFAVLRSLGMSVRQLFVQNLAQTGLLGLTAGLAAAPLGAALAWLLVHVINRRSFGWSMDFIVAPNAVLAGVSMAVAAALPAGIYPAFVGARADMGLAWRDD
jgi:putative ABC transport system permease protein